MCVWDAGISSEIIALKVHLENVDTILLMGTTGMFCLFLSHNSIAKVWDSGQQWCGCSCILHLVFTLAVTSSPPCNHFYVDDQDLSSHLIELLSVETIFPSRNDSLLLRVALHDINKLRRFDNIDTSEMFVLKVITNSLGRHVTDYYIQLMPRARYYKASCPLSKSCTSSLLERPAIDVSIGTFSGLITEFIGLVSTSINRDHSCELLGTVGISGNSHILMALNGCYNNNLEILFGGYDDANLNDNAYVLDIATISIVGHLLGMEKIMVASSLKGPILFYDEIISYEDQLVDNGILLLRDKVRVMPTGLFLFLRSLLRVRVLMRLRDTCLQCLFGEHNKSIVLRESCGSDTTFQALSSKGYPCDFATYRDPSIIWLKTRKLEIGVFCDSEDKANEFWTSFPSCTRVKCLSDAGCIWIFYLLDIQLYYGLMVVHDESSKVFDMTTKDYIWESFSMVQARSIVLILSKEFSIMNLEDKVLFEDRGIVMNENDQKTKAEGTFGNLANYIWDPG